MNEESNGEIMVMDDIFRITQLPVIYHKRLEALGAQVQEQVSAAIDTAATEESVKALKALRAELNKDLNMFEGKRKDVKNAILHPYHEFETDYELHIFNVYQFGIDAISKQITQSESVIRAQREDALNEYFGDYKLSKESDLGWLTLAMTGIKTNLSCSMKSLKDSVKKFTDRVAEDLEAIQTHEDSAEILVEYKQKLNLGQAISTVSTRQKAIAQQKEIDKSSVGMKPIPITPAKSPAIEPEHETPVQSKLIPFVSADERK